MIGSRRLWKTLARLVLTVLVAGTLVYFVNWRRILATLLGADLAWLLPAYGLVVVRRAIEAGQLAQVLRYVGSHLTWWRVFCANALSAFYALVTPGSVIAMGVKWTDLAAATGRRAIVLNAIVYSRLMLDLQPLIIGAIALAWANPTGEPAVTVVACLLAALGLAAGLCLFTRWLGPSTRRASAALGRFLPVALRSRVDRLIDELEPFRAFSAARHLTLAAMGLASLAVGITVRVMIMNSLGFSVPLSTIIWVDAILVIAMHVPITIGNLGVREGLVVAVFGLYGVPADAAVAYGLLVYSCRLIQALVGGGYQLALIAGWTTMRTGLKTAPVVGVDGQPASQADRSRPIRP